MSKAIQPLILDEFGTPECHWNETQSIGKKIYLIFLFVVLIADTGALISNLTHPPYDAFDVFQIILESFLLIILIPRFFGKGPAMKRLSVENGKLHLKYGIAYKRMIPLDSLDKISVSKNNMGTQKMVLHYKKGKPETTRFYLSLIFPEDRKRINEWMEEVNREIENKE